MGFSERLKEIRIGNGLSQKELADMVNTSAAAIGNYECGLNYPKITVLMDLMACLNCDANYFYQDYLPPSYAENKFTEEEVLLIKKYRKLNAHGKKAVKAILDVEYKCAEEWFENGNLIGLDMCHPILKSRGYVLSPTCSKIQVAPTETNKLADFCVKLISNSTKPIFRTGDVVLFKKEPVPHNDIGLFRVNGIIHIKKLYKMNGQTRLMPFNVSTEPVEVKETDKFEVLGRYVGKLERNYIE